jgi:hypothetical protein
MHGLDCPAYSSATSVVTLQWGQVKWIGMMVFSKNAGKKRYSIQ